jgi:hypothetical protein
MIGQHLPFPAIFFFFPATLTYRYRLRALRGENIYIYIFFFFFLWGFCVKSLFRIFFFLHLDSFDSNEFQKRRFAVDTLFGDELADREGGGTRKAMLFLFST